MCLGPAGLLDSIMSLVVSFVGEGYFSAVIEDVVVLTKCDGDIALYALFETDHGVGAVDPGNLLDAIVEEVLEVFVVLREEFDDHTVGACGKVALYDLRNFVEFLNNGIVHVASLEFDADERTCAESEIFGVHLIATASDDATFEHTYDTLVNGSTRYTAVRSNLFEAAAGVDGDDFKYFSV